MEKTHVSRGRLTRGVGYAKVEYEGFYCNKNFVHKHNSFIKSVTLGKRSLYIIFIMTMSLSITGDLLGLLQNQNN